MKKKLVVVIFFITLILISCGGGGDGRGVDANADIYSHDSDIFDGAWKGTLTFDNRARPYDGSQDEYCSTKSASFIADLNISKDSYSDYYLDLNIDQTDFFSLASESGLKSYNIYGQLYFDKVHDIGREYFGKETDTEIFLSGNYEFEQERINPDDLVVFISQPYSKKLCNQDPKNLGTSCGDFIVADIAIRFFHFAGSEGSCNVSYTGLLVKS